MAEYRCGNCRETFAGSISARFCPGCGSSSLILVVKEQTEPHQKETVGVYKSATIVDTTPSESVIEDPIKEEEDQPRKPRRR